MGLIFKCKMCGGDISVSADMTIGICEYCGSQQTISKADNEKIISLYNRANKLRIANEFDKAAGIYESIIASNEEEAEAYWGLCLCKYGIEYVDDPKTKRKIPTCHRTSYESIFNDENFELALENADEDSISIYRSEAKEIDRLQKKILSIANEEAPYDVFICYKEMDKNGERTEDSVLGQDIYDALINKGLKVFFSRITLEDKLGQEYEPYIFSALNTAKIMIAVGTSYENYNAVWVKNEWGRYLQLMKNDKSKVLIPCYKNIDAYDMPEEFNSFQGQDMSKLGAIQDLIRGVSKILNISADNAQVSTVTSTKTPNDSGLLKRGTMALVDREWEKADGYFDQALNENPEIADAYVGRVLATYKVQSLSELAGLSIDLHRSKDYERAMRFADGSLEMQLKETIKSCDNCLEKHLKSIKKRRLRICITILTVLVSIFSIYFLPPVVKPAWNYQKALKLESEEKYDEAIGIFESISPYRDSAEQSEKCKDLKAEEEYEAILELYSDGSKSLAYTKLNKWILEHKDYAKEHKGFIVNCCNEMIQSQEYDSLIAICSSIYEQSKVDKSVEQENMDLLRNFCLRLVDDKVYKEALEISSNCNLEQVYDDDEYLCAIRYAYVLENGSAYNRSTVEYVNYLIEKKYKDIEDIKDSYLSWKVVMYLCDGIGRPEHIRNKSEKDNLYLKCSTYGGSGEKESGFVKWTFSNGEENQIPIELEAEKTNIIKLGKHLPEGKLTVSVYDEKGNEVDSCEMEIKYFHRG